MKGRNGVEEAGSRKPARRSKRRADIQGMRAVAVAMVVAYHAGIPPSGGYIGVDVFFVISGFVVGGVLLRELGRGSGLGFRAFYAKRARRLLPALALMTTLVAAASTVLLSPLTTQRSTARTGIAASLFAANIQLANVPKAGYFDAANSTNALLHTWSLSVEEQFYLGFPALLAGLWWLASRRSADQVRRRQVVAVLLALSAASLLLALVATYRQSDRLGDAFAFYMAPARAWEFAAGVILALVAHRLTRIPAPVAIVLGLVGAGILGFGAFTFDDATPFPGFAALVPVLATALLIVAGTATDRGVSRALSVRPAVWVGDVSYGWYLWHWPLIVFAAVLWPGQDRVLVVVALVSLIPTVLSYRFVENPIRFAPDAATRRTWPLLAVCILVPVAAFAGVLVVGRVQARSATFERLAHEIRPHEDRRLGCDVPEPIGERANADCTWTVDDPKGEIYLVGDSNAGHFSEPLIAAGNEAGYDVTVAVSAGCPFADVVRRAPAPGFDGEVCRDSVSDSIDALVAQQPSLVVFSMSSNEYVNESSNQLVDPETGKVGRTPEEKSDVYEAGLRRALQELGEAGIPTAVVHTVPQFNATLGARWKAETCAAIQVYLDRCGGSRSLAGVQREGALAVAAEDGAVDGLDSSTTVEVDDLLCRDGRCSTSRGDLRLYRDASHLTVDGAGLVTPRFLELIEQQAAPRSSGG